MNKPMKNIILIFLAFYLCQNAYAEDVATQLSAEAQLIKNTLTTKAKVAGEKLYSKKALIKFYSERSFEPAWDTLSQKMISEIGRTEEDGLNPKYYHLEKLSAPSTETTALLPTEIDILLSDSFLLIASHLKNGLIHPYGTSVQWFMEKDGDEFVALLNRAITTKNITAVLDELAPDSPRYRLLKQALKQYTEIKNNGGWPTIAQFTKEKEKIYPGDIDPRVVPLRQRLSTTGEYKSKTVTQPDLFDQELSDAVLKFQENVGLLPDGVFGRNTVSELNVSVEKRICEIKAGLDRFRGLAYKYKDEKYVLVNIPAFEVSVIENRMPVLKMKAVVGRFTRQTPLLSDEITHIIFSPTWNVPETILYEDKIPIIAENPEFLAKNNMKVYDTSTGKRVEVDPSTIDWKTADKTNFSYKIVQGSGVRNALGQIKFMFPNKYDVYLHDTPEKALFERSSRPFSSGCMRINKPVELAKYFLSDKPEWTDEKIKQEMNRRSELYVYLTKPVPIHVTYVTSWIDDKGNLNFRKDIYLKDKIYFNTLCK